ncbi:NucA/NucB deoxyribonuclease domain-containing protein [Streptomyces bullii]|uniref:Deoxyribonuclease NucA/NucB domain-containing protein n=1 Tax=Streptomyces bullii TaxID=349910 RepID=A0ABW0UW93_9ACTN
MQDDSCDEFPFARTYEGGTDGALCADVVPKQVGDQWLVFEADPTKPVTFTESCARGHVPLTDNKAAGGKLGSFPQTDRVLDTEKYDVTVTA